MRQRALISVVILFCLNAGFLYSQVQTLDPSKTVNPATGEMGFAIPLGTVQGISNGFPVNLYYKAGIQLDQEASPAGLGFGYEPGTITRKTVFVPDDAHGESGYFYTKPKSEADEPTWRKVLNVILTVASIVLTIILAIVGGPAASGGVALTVAIWVVNGVQFTINMIPITPGNYIAGGEHTLSYTGDQGTGFLRGAVDDIPDIFFVNTPFITGQFSWEGDRTNGRFVLKNAAGSNEKKYETVKIIKKTDADGYLLFEIVLSDGTRLIFDKYDKYPHFEEIWQMSKWGKYDVCGKSITHTTEGVPNTWHLTKILYSDYFDGGGLADDPLDSRSTNKGEWVAFEYDSIAMTRIFQAFRMSQLHGSTTLHALVGRINNQTKFPDGHTPLQPITLSWLKTIHTPVDSAVFTYSMDRKDDLWFDAENNNAIVSMPVLRTICLKNKDGSEKLTYTFNTGYDLRQNSFNSFKKSWQLRGTNDRMLWPEQVERQSDNYDAKSLTLRSISVTSAGKALPSIVFSYDENTNFAAYNIAADNKIEYKEFEMDFGCHKDEYPEPSLYQRHWYIDQKDYWGYFRRNTTGSNNFNADGEKTAACVPGTDIPYASAWSLKKIKMPSGQTIEWEYEANRFNFANGIQLEDASHNPKEQYGGGIRVREIKIGDGLSSKKQTISYFYTQMPTAGDFEETATNSCGHVTAMPNPYLLDEIDDKRPVAARGGLYTPANIAYEQCIVAANYDRDNHVAPNGYTVYKFVTCKDFPNTGSYGMTDYSWKRGMLHSVEVYNRGNKLLSRDESTYEYHEQEHTLPLMPYNSFYTKTLLENTSGWVKLKKTEKTVNGVKTSSNMLYANDLTTAAADKISVPQKKLRVFDANDLIPPYTNTSQMDMNDRVVVCKKTDTGDPSKEKIAIVRTDGGIALCMGINVNKDYTTHSSTEKWSEWRLYFDGTRVPYAYYVIGAQFYKMDSNNDDDLIVVLTDNMEFQTTYYLYVYVFHDIRINASKELEYNDGFGNSGPSLTILNRNGTDVYKCPVRCMIGDLHGNPDKPDFLVLTNTYYPQEYFPGDLVPGQNRAIYAIMDFQEISPFSTYVPIVYRTATDYPYFGHCSFFTALEPDGVKNDLIITGPGITTNAWLPNLPRPIAYQKFKNVSFDDVNKRIVIPGGCENCGTASELFTIRPRYGWASFALGGAFYDGAADRLQLICPEWSSNGFHFNIFDYLPVAFNGDYDGAPNRSYTKNSDGSILLTVATPAYAQPAYEEMGDPEITANKHMLIQSSGGVTYNFPAGTSVDILKGALSGEADRVVVASASTWIKTNNVNNIWLPCASYVWKVPMSSSGLATTAYVPFNYSSPRSSDAAWKLTDSICKYTSNSLPKETAKPTSSGGRLLSSIIYGHKGSITTGKVVNASFEECGVFTGDYDLDPAGSYFDLENGWARGLKAGGASSVFEGAKHFGDKGIGVLDAFGPTRAFKLQKGRDYILSAWIQPVLPEGEIYVPVEKGWVMDVTYRRSSDDGASWPIQVYPNSTSQPELPSSGIINAKKYGDWYYVQLPVPAKKDISDAQWNNGYQYAVVWVGCPNGNGAGQSAIVYIDDIRFYPKDAMVTSTYYDKKWYQPILSVDANNNPSQKVEYDDFGRPIRWYKINQKNPANVTLLQQKEYHMMNDFYAPNPNKWYKIVPEANENYCIDIQDAEWRNSKEIHLFTYRGALNQLWKFVSAGGGYYTIESKGGSGVRFGIDDPFAEVNDGRQLLIYTVSDNNQKWKLTDAGDGFCRIAAHANAGAYIGLAGGNAADNGIVQIWNHDEYTRWKLVEVDDEIRIKNATMDFYIGKTEVTQADYQAIMGSTPSFHPGATKPVERVTWYDAILYCNKRSEMEGLIPVYTYTGTPDMLNGHCVGLQNLNASEMDFSNKFGYRLPTEEEWRAAYYQGTTYTTGRFWGPSEDDAIVSKYAWYRVNSLQTTTHAVGQFEPNKAGLFDMAGNVLEYVWYTKPAEPNYTRIYGGGYIDPPSQLGGDYCVYEEKSSTSATALRNYVGFRVVRTAR